MVSQAGLTVMNYYLPSLFPINEPKLYIVIYSSSIIALSKSMLVLFMLNFLKSTVITCYFILFHYYF